MRKILRGHVINKAFLFLLCFGLSFYATRGQMSGTYTINSALATGGSNFQTFSAAVSSLSSNGINGAVVFNVAAGSGPYNEQVIINSISGSSATNTITFNCNGVTLRYLSTSNTQRACIKLNSADYITFNNLTVTPLAVNNGEYGYGFHLINDADNNTISNCTITVQSNMTTAENNEGIVINGADDNALTPGYSNCDNNLIQQCVITGGNDGISVTSVPVSGNPIRYVSGNRILNNTISDAYNAGIQLYYNDGTVVYGNDISGGAHAITNVFGMFLGAYNQDVKITYNRIHHFVVPNSITGSIIYGIMNSSLGTSGKPNLIGNNLIYAFSSNNSQYGIASRYAPASFFNIYHNTISLDDQSIQGSETNGLYFENISDVNVLNNIVTVSRLTSDWNFGVNFEQQPTRYTANRNVYYVPTTTAYICAVVYYGTNPYYSIKEWKKATGFDYHSVALDPGYTNAAAYDFKPTTQAIDNMALFVNITTDMAGVTRSPLNPDPGVLEFVSAACQTPVTPGVTEVLPDSVLCYGPTIALGLADNSWGVGQTYTWQSSTNVNGPYTDISTGIAYPAFDITPATTMYYRAAVTCMTNTEYSTPLRVIIHTMLPGGTYTINKAEPTGGTNFASFTDAVLGMQCGITGPVVFNVVPGSGPYNEQITIPALNTSASRTITFNGNGDTLAFAAIDNDQRALIKLNGTDYVTIDSLNMKVTGASFGFGVQMINDADHNIVQRCTITMSNTVTTSGYAGIVINPSHSDARAYTTPSYCDSNLITRNTIKGGYFGISCISSSEFVGASSSVGNVISHNTILDPCAYGIYVGGTSNTLVDSNDISQPTRTNYLTFYGIYSWHSNFGLTVSKNRIHNLLDSNKVSTVQIEGIHFERTTGLVNAPNIVCNNLMYNFKGDGWQYGLYTITSNHLKFYHNTVSLEDSGSKASASVPTRGFGLFGLASTGTELRNNNIIIRRSGAGTRHCIFMNIIDNNFISNNNNLLIQATTGTSYTARMGSTNYATLSNWQAIGKDAASISMDPVYKDPENADFTPTRMPFDNRGVGVGVGRDIIDTSRSATTPDIGAFEFSVCKELSTPVLSVDSAGSYTVRFIWTAVPNTPAYLVSRDGGVTWATPSSGPLGLTHTINGLKSRDTVGLMVKAIGTRWDCPPVYSNWVTAQTVTDQVFIPNTFTPNGNGKNDEFKVYSNIVKSLHLMVYNQWGEKVFEATDMNTAWDGSYKGKPQPVGVYIYVAVMELADNSKVTHKGTFNLIR